MFQGITETQHIPLLQPMSLDADPNIGQPFVKILEQPAKVARFRYECESRSAGLPGVSSTPDNKTFPTIQVVGFRGRARVVVSCVSKDAPYRPHPHKLVGREGIKYGVCTLDIPPDTMTMQFSHLGIQCVKRRNVEASLRERQERRIDPFGTGFNNTSSIKPYVVRLCFQVFLKAHANGKFDVPLAPVVSDPIINKKDIAELVICKLSHCTSYVDGNSSDIIMLCGKISKDDIQIRFFEERDGGVVWEGFGEFRPSEIHRRSAISFRPPKYHDLEVQEPVKVFIQLMRPSDKVTSESLPFQFLPSPEKKRKRPKFDSISALNFQMEATKNNLWPQGSINDVPNIFQPDANQFNMPTYQELPSTSTNPPPSFIENWNILCLPKLEPECNKSMNLERNDQYLTNSPLKQISISSGELGSFVTSSEIGNLSDYLNYELSLSDIQPRSEQNMSDSLTRLVNNTVKTIM